MGSSRGLTANEQKILEDFRAKQAQRTASAVTKSGVDPNERLRLARRRQAEQDNAQRESQSISARQNLIARQQADQNRKNVEIARKEAEADRQRIAQQQSQEQAQKQREAQAFADKQRSFLTPNTGFKPTAKQAQLSKDVTKFLAERKQKEQQTQQVKQVEQTRNTKRTVFTNNSNVSIANAIQLAKSNLPDKPTIRPLTDAQKVAPQFLDGSVKRFLTEDPKKDRNNFSFIPSIPEASAEEFPQSQNVSRQGFAEKQQAPRPTTRSLGEGESFRSIIPNPNAGQVIRVNEDGSKEVQGSFSVLSGVTGSQSKPERPPISKNFVEGFFAGSKQELVNFSNIADIATGKEGTIGRAIGLSAEESKTKKEVGSSIVDLPFAVGESLLFNEEGGFNPNLDRAFERSGAEQKFIADEFERDPARAIGSTVTALGTEVALIIGTAGTATVARKGIVKTAQFVAKSKNAKQALKIARKLDIQLGEKNVPFIVEEIVGSKGTQFEIIRGIEALGKKGVKVFRGTDQGIVQSIGAKGELILTKIPKIYGVGKKGLIKKGGSRQRLDTSKAVITSQENSSDIPLTIVKLGGKKNEIITFTKEIPKRTNVQTRGTVVLEGVTGEEVTASRNIGQQIATGLKPFESEVRVGVNKNIQGNVKNVVGESTQLTRQFTAEGVEVGGQGVEDTLRLIGKPTKLTNKKLDELSDTGFIQEVARGTRFGLDDFIKNPKAITKIARTGKTIEQELPKSSKEFKTARAFERVPVSEARVTTFEIFSTKAEGQAGKIKGLPKVGKETEFVKGKKFDFGSSGSKSTGIKVESNLGKGSRSVTKTAPEQDIGRIRSTFKDVAKSKSKQQTRADRLKIIKNKRLDSIASATRTGGIVGTSLGFGSAFETPQTQKGGQKGSTRTEFGSILIPLSDTGLINEEKETTVFPRPTKIRPDVIQKQDEALIITPITETIPIIDTPTIPVIDTPTKPIPTTTTIPTPFGLPRNNFASVNKRDASRRKSGQGKRLFDVAETPFGEVTVGLGFFIEQKGDETIAESIGVPERKKVVKKKKTANPVDSVFGVQSGQFDTTFDF